MNTNKETNTGRKILGTNANKEMLFLLIEGQINQITKETEKAICYHGHGKWLNSSEHMLYMWIPKSIAKIENRNIEKQNGNIENIKCLIVPAWFYNNFLNDKNLIDFF